MQLIRQKVCVQVYSFCGSKAIEKKKERKGISLFDMIRESGGVELSNSADMYEQMTSSDGEESVINI